MRHLRQPNFSKDLTKLAIILDYKRPGMLCLALPARHKVLKLDFQSEFSMSNIILKNRVTEGVASDSHDTTVLSCHHSFWKSPLKEKQKKIKFLDKIQILLNLLHRSPDVWTCYPRPNNAYEPHLSVIGYNFSYYIHYSWSNNATQKMSAINTKVHEQRTHGKGFTHGLQTHEG
jgi:hypothetical protein